MQWKADFHNHSCLSPCGSLELSPRVLVQEAKSRGIQILGLTDHNCARNTPAFEALCKAAGILPLCGLEVTTVEEIHVLALFSSSSEALEFGARIEGSLVKKIPLQRDRWGDQIVVDAQENILEEIDFYLNIATRYSLEELGALIRVCGGLFIPAHVDRPRDSIMSQLGLIPELPYSGLEVMVLDTFKAPGPWPLVQGSDAHYPENIGQRTCTLDLPTLSWQALKNILHHTKETPS